MFTFLQVTENPNALGGYTYNFNIAVPITAAACGFGATLGVKIALGLLSLLRFASF